MASRRTPAPATASPEIDVFDLDAAKAQRYEAGAPNTFTFRFGGDTFSIPLDLKVSTLRKLREIDADDVDRTFEIILGDQAARFLEKDPSLQDVQALVTEYQKRVGASVGKSSDSQSS